MEQYISCLAFAYNTFQQQENLEIWKIKEEHLLTKTFPLANSRNAQYYLEIRRFLKRCQG